MDVMTAMYDDKTLHLLYVALIGVRLYAQEFNEIAKTTLYLCTKHFQDITKVIDLANVKLSLVDCQYLM